MRVDRYNIAMPWAEPEPPRDPLVQQGLDLLGAAVRRARHRHGWSQRNLAERTGIHQSTLSRFERGDRVGIRFSRFAMLVAVLGGLDFLPPELEREPRFTTRRQYLQWANASEAAWFRRHPILDPEDDQQAEEAHAADPEADPADPADPEVDLADPEAEAADAESDPADRADDRADQERGPTDRGATAR